MSRKCIKNFIFLVCVIFLGTSLVGCASLRGKFVRKKNAKNESAILPVYEPIDYESSAKNSSDKYWQHYRLWQGWRKELLTHLDRKENLKRIKYLTEQLKIQIAGMQEQVNADKKLELDEIKGDIDKILVRMDRPIHMLDTRTIHSDVLKIESKLRNQFHPNMIQDSLL